MSRIAGAAEDAVEEALLAQFRAATAATPELRRQHERMAAGWQALARHYREAERISGYIQWQAQRVAAP